MAGNDSFSMKEMMIIVMDDLKGFRKQYDEDQEALNDKFAKRPTWGQMTSLIGGAGVLVTIVVSLVGG